MRIVVILLALCAFTLAGASGAAAEAKKDSGVRIVAFPKEGRMEADGSGHYAELVRTVLAEAGYNDQLITVPVKRSLRYFETLDELCMVPLSKFGLSHMYPNTDPNSLIQGVPIDYITGHLVTRPGAEPIRDMQLIEGKAVASWSGVNVDVLLPDSNFTLLQSETEASAIRMLMTGRVDIIWGWVPDTFILFEEMGLGKPSLALDKPIFESSAHFVCKKTRRSEKLMPRLDAVIERMRNDGRLKKILGPHTRVIGVDVPMSVANPD